MSISLIFLSSCSLNIITSNSNGDSSKSSSQSSSSSTSSDDKGDPSNPILKTKLSYTYDEYCSNNVSLLDNCPLTGSPKLLVFPVWFNDSSSFISEAKKETVRDDIRKAYFGSNADVGYRSVKTYYEELSGGKLTLDGTVTNWFNVNSSYKDYQSEKSGGDRTSALVKSLTDTYFSNHSDESRSDYDLNNDGYLDGVILIYAAPDYTQFNNYQSKDYYNLWAYCFWLQEENTSKTDIIPNVFFWASYDFMYSSSTAKSQTGYSYGTGDTTNATIDTHTFIHEMGHVLGLEDYYDYSYQYSPAGGFSMQDNNVGSHDPYSVMALGWSDPYIPTESMTLTIRPFQSSKDLILLTPSFNSNNSPFDEYLLLEYYTPTGLNEFDTLYQYGNNYPRGVNDYGIRVWHVDARLVYYSDYYSKPKSSNITTDVTKGVGTNHAMSNTYLDSKDGYGQDYLSVLGSQYYNYNILQLIKNDTSANYKPSANTSFAKADLFKEGDSFSMSTYSKQFVNSKSLNSGYSLGWSFNIISMNNEKAVIELIKN